MLLRSCGLVGLCFVVAVGCGGASRPTVGAEPMTIPSALPTPPRTPIAAERDTNTFAAEDDAAVPVSISDPVWGSRNALVTIVFFGDFQCPFTARSVTTMSALQEKYGPTALRIVWKNEPLPFHPHAREAAEAAEVVNLLGGSAAFWRFHKSVFENQTRIGEGTLAEWAESAGVDGASFRRMTAAHAGVGKVDADHALAKVVGVNGTPSFFINGVILGGAQPLEKFVSLVDRELDKAKERIAAGTPADRVYAAMARENFANRPAKAVPDDDGDKDDTTTVWKVPVGSSPIRGSATALVTIVEFSDFQCPYCKKVEETLKTLRTKYGDKLRIVWKEGPLPFHPRAEPAAEVAREARAEKGDAAFWSVHDALFASQPKLEDSDFDAIAGQSNLDVAAVREAIRTHRYKARIDADAELSDDLQASGTPHFFINGRRLVGAQPSEKFEAMIDPEILHAQALLAKGTPPAALYDTLIKDGKGAPEPTVKIVPLAPGAPSKGTGSVVIQEFGDFQCPFTARAQDAINEVMKTYAGKVRLVWRNLPLPMHVQAELAAEAAMEAQRQQGNDAFFKMHDKLFAGQKVQGGLERAAIDGYAGEIGLDMAQFQAALDTHSHKAKVQADAKAAADAGISGTPAFSVGGYFLSGAQGAQKFKRLLDRVLASGPAKVAPVAIVAPTDKLVIVDLSVGTGPATKAGDTINVHYVGHLTDGTEFDSSRKRGQPFSFPIGQGRVIKGWEQGLVGMKVGGKRKLTIPPSLAYGDRAVGAIPAKSTLIFEVELLAIQ